MYTAAPATTATQTYKTPRDVTFYGAHVFLRLGALVTEKKIIIICKINKLFCQDFQRHHHSCANRLAVTQPPTPPDPPPGQSQAKLPVHDRLHAPHFTPAVGSKSAVKEQESS